MLKQMRETPLGWIIRRLTWRGWQYQDISDPKSPTWLSWSRHPTYQPDHFIAYLAWYSRHKPTQEKN